MQKFTDFILQVTYPPNPIRALNNSLTADQQAGRNFYFNNISDVVETCNGCHVLEPANGFFGSNGFSTFENETQHFKIAHLRNLYQKVGMFGMPAIPFIIPGNNGNQGQQVRGFGFLHDGSIDTIFRFHNATVFTGFPNGTSGVTLRRQMEQFMLAFDSNLAPIVGQQITLTSLNGGVAGPRISLLIARAAANECDVVVKGLFPNLMLIREQRGWVRTAAGTFRSDRTGEALLTDAQLRAQANTANQELTYTCVPPGSGVRIGIDRDEDGFPDRTELDQGTDPADPLSFPGSGSTTTTTTVTVTSSTTTTSTTMPAGRSACTSKKILLAGKKANSRAKCHGKAIGNGTTVAPDCLQTATNKFSAGWAKAEAPPNDCRTTADEGAIENRVDSGTNSIAVMLAPTSNGPSRCTKKKFSAAGKRASAETKCHGKAASQGVAVSATCLQRAVDRYGTSWTKAEGAGDCLTTNDRTSIGNSVRSMVDGIVGALNP